MARIWPGLGHRYRRSPLGCQVYDSFMDLIVFQTKFCGYFDYFLLISGGAPASRCALASPTLVFSLLFSWGCSAPSCPPHVLERPFICYEIELIIDVVDEPE